MIENKTVDHLTRWHAECILSEWRARTLEPGTAKKFAASDAGSFFFLEMAKRDSFRDESRRVR